MGCKSAFTVEDATAAKALTGKIEQAASSNMALEAFQQGIDNYMTRHNGGACTSDLQFFSNMALNQVERDGSKMVQNMALAWAAKGDSISGSVEASLNADHKGVKESDLDSFIKATERVGNVGHSMALKFKENFDSYMMPVGGVNLGIATVLGDGMVSQDRISSLTSTADAQIEQAHERK
jgi:hypothetical protein